MNLGYGARLLALAGMQGTGHKFYAQLAIRLAAEHLLAAGDSWASPCAPAPSTPFRHAGHQTVIMTCQ